MGRVVVVAVDGVVVDIALQGQPENHPQTDEHMVPLIQLLLNLTALEFA